MSKLSYTILIAEDDNRTRQALTHSLAAVGYTVIAAADGQEALLRRIPHRSEKPHRSEETATPSQQTLRTGQLTIDPITRRAYRGSHQLHLTEIEFRLIELLASNPGHILSRGDILEALWGYDASSASDTKTVDVHISRLRIKLDDHTHNPDFIVTIRGRGYMFLMQR